MNRLERQTLKKIRRARNRSDITALEVTTKMEKSGKDTYQLSVTVQPGKPVLIKDIKMEIRGPGAFESSLSELYTFSPLPKDRGCVMTFTKGKRGNTAQGG